MTTEAQFKEARDITPHFGVMTVVRDGKTVNIPLLPGDPGALFIADDQGLYFDSDGSEWLVGTRGREVVKRRVR